MLQVKMELPTWLDSQFLSEVLQEGNEGKTEVVNFTVKPAVAPGNNYLSQVYRVKVEYKLKELDPLQAVSLIVKAPNFMLFPGKEQNDLVKSPPEGAASGVPEEDDFFEKEPKVFTELIPKMHEKVNYIFSPKYYPCSVKGGLVLEDLREDGYVMCDRFKQLDYEHCKEVLTALAKFHAISVSCHNDNPSLFKSIGCYMDKTNEVMDAKMKCGMEYAARKVAELTKETHKEFSELLLRKVDHLWDTSSKMFKPQVGKLNVLNHGDLWTTNVLFKYSANGDIERVKLIDYQLTRYTSPASDVTFFIWTSGNNDVREKHQMSLYKIYLQTLNKTLEEMGCKERLSEEEFHEDLREMADVVLSVVSHVLPIFMADPEDGPIKLEELNPEDPDNEMCHKLYKGKYYRKLLPFIAKQYLSWHSSLYSSGSYF